MRTPDTYLAGIGVFLPERVAVASAVEQGWVDPEAAREGDIVGVAVAGERSPAEMALAAARDAVRAAGCGAAGIGLMLCCGVWHQGPDGWGLQYYLQRHLLEEDALAVEVRSGCNGVFGAMELAIPHLQASPGVENVLVTASDNFGTPLIDRWTSTDGMSYLGDGASAVVLSSTGGFAELRSVTTSTFPGMEEVHRAGEPLFPPGAPLGVTVDYGARSRRFQKTATADGTWIGLLLGHQRHNVACTAQALDEAGVDPEDIAHVLVHSMPRQAAASYLTILGFSLERSTWAFSRTVGHLGASDHLAALHHLVSTGRVRPGDHLLLCGFSPGVTYKAAVVRILEAGGGL